MPPTKGYNTGRWLASPLQSGYATLRQRLIANPGVATSTVFLETFGYNHTLWNYSPQKHCPECAKALYHNTLFDYCWLHRCPAHGLLLQNRCERCGHPWPSSSALHKRSCPSCGVPEWDVLPVDAGLDAELLDPIKRVRCFLEDNTFDDHTLSGEAAIFDLCFTYLWDSKLRYAWPRRVTKSSAAFPVFQLASTSGHSQVELEKFGVVFPEFSIESITSPLRRLKLRPPSKASWYDRLKREGPIRRPPARAQRIIEQCYNDILVWCNRHHEKGHQLRLGDFRYHSFQSLASADYYLCPFCFAISAWWDAVTQKYFSPWQCSLPIEYWWTQYVHWTTWPDASDRLLILGNPDEYWRPGARFEERYFARSLLLLFAELYQSGIHLMDRVKKAESPFRETFDPANFYSPGHFTASQCLWRITENHRIEWLWPDVDPLEELDPPRPSTRQRLCGGTWPTALESGAEALLSDLSQESNVKVSRDRILEIGALFHTGRFESRPRRDSWTILERPLSHYYPPFARF